MKLNFQKILSRANSLYCKEKLKGVPPERLAYWAPEMFPKIQSDSVKCILQALVDAINGGEPLVEKTLHLKKARKNQPKVSLAEAQSQSQRVAKRITKAPRK